MTLDTEGVFDRMVLMLMNRTERLAETIAWEAKARCPVRRPSGGRRPRAVAFVPGGRYQFGQVSLSARRISKAAARIGINLGDSQAARLRKYGKTLEIIEVKKRRKSGQENVKVPRLRTYSERNPVEQIGFTYSAKRMAKREADRAQLRASRSKGDFRRAIDANEAKPGALRASIHVMPAHVGSTIKFEIIADARRPDGKSYARYVEFPTSDTAAQPFLLPALMNGKARAKRILLGGDW